MSNRCLKLVLCIAFSLSFIFSGYFLFASPGFYDMEYDLAKKDFSNEAVTVKIIGEVKNEGVYTVNKGKTYYDALYMAGGLTKDAYALSVNLADKIYEPCEIEIISLKGLSMIEKREFAIGSDAGSHKININTASDTHLKMLDGIGKSLAKRIVKYRDKNGNFKSTDGILNVKGIGFGTYRKIKDYITVGEE